MNKKFFVAALALLALTSINARQVSAQSCPAGSVQSFGARAPQPVDKSLQSQIEVTYFTTTDPDAFISERAGLRSSASSINLDTNQFVAMLGKLERAGIASIRKQQAVTSYLGELAELKLERSAGLAEARTFKPGSSWQSANHASALDRQTDISVYKNSGGSSSAYYRVSLLSWFVDGSVRGGQKIADYDADILLRPGETAVFKLVSDYEVKRSGAPRSYVAVTMRSVGRMSAASARGSRAVASR